MVGCPHLGRAVRVAAVEFERLNLADCPSSPKLRAHNNSQQDGLEKNDSSAWFCVVCGSQESPWICLSCGLIHCGRYSNGDGLHHYENHEDHALTMDCFSYTVFCYKCDDYVAGDTIDRKIYNMRNSLQYHNSTRRSLEDETEEEDSGRNSRKKETSRSYDEEDIGSVLEYPSTGNKLRARKRKHSPTSEYWKSGDDACFKGLRNLGNTCFMNAVLQALNSLETFREFMVKLPSLEYDDLTSTSSQSSAPRYRTRRIAQASTADQTIAERDGSSMLAEELRKTLIALTPNGSPSAVSPDALHHAVWNVNDRFIGYHQQDCHEFLRYTLDQLHADLRRCRIPDDCAWRVANKCAAEYSPTSSAVSLMFEGALQSQVTCMSCKMTSNKQDPFLDLSLDVHIPPSPNARSVVVNLTECIRRFFEKEQLEHCEEYMCGSCEERKPSTKQLFLRCLPKILCLHLKRFRWSHTSRGKVDNMVDFPLCGLDLSQYVSPNSKVRANGCVYDLTSIVVHHGTGMGGGHYTSYGLRDGQWAHFNDSTVKFTDTLTVLKQKAYILFYTRTR